MTANEGDTPQASSSERTENGIGTPDADKTRSPRLRRLAVLILPLGLLAASSIVSPHLPHDHTVRIQLGAPEQIVGVHVQWIPAQSSSRPDPDDAAHGSRWNFARGAAPKSLTTTIRLPNGAYDVAIEIERADRVQTVQRKIILGGDELVSLNAQ